MKDAQTAAPAAYVLRVRHSDGSEEVHALRDETVTIGRASINTVVLRDSLASRFHARIEWEQGRYLLTDRGSKNGVVVRGSPVPSHVLAPGDEILVGDTMLRFEAASDLPEATATELRPRRAGAPEGLEPMARKLAAAEDLGALEEVALHLRSLVACDRASVAVFEEGGPATRLRFCRPGGPDGAAEGPDEAVVRAGWAAERPAAMSLARSDDTLDGTLDVSRHVLVVPVTVGERREALLALERKPFRPPFTADELRVAVAAGAHVRSFLRRFL